MNSAQPLALKWHDGSKTKLDAAFTHDGGLVCARIANEPTSATHAVSLTLQGALSVKSDDDRIDGTWQGASVYADGAADGTLGDVRVVFGTRSESNAPIEDLVGKYGIHGIDASGYDDATVEFWLQFVAGSTRDLTGMLRVSGVILPMCPQPPSDPNMDTPDCHRIDLTRLDWATLTEP